MKGIWGKLLEIDLTSGKTKNTTISRRSIAWKRKYMTGMNSLSRFW